MNLNRWTVCGIALVSFAAGSIITTRLAHVNAVKADSNRVFELRIYHPVPGKLAAVESRFRDTAANLLAKHDLKPIGFWSAEDSSTFVYILAHPSREDAKKNWSAMFADPEFQEMMKSEKADKTVEKVDSTYMRPTDFSPIK